MTDHAPARSRFAVVPTCAISLFLLAACGGGSDPGLAPPSPELTDDDAADTPDKDVPSPTDRPDADTDSGPPTPGDTPPPDTDTNLQGPGDTPPPNTDPVTGTCVVGLDDTDYADDIPETAWSEWVGAYCSDPADQATCEQKVARCTDGSSSFIVVVPEVDDIMIWLFFDQVDGALIARHVRSDTDEFCGDTSHDVWLGRSLPGCASTLVPTSSP